MKKAVKRRPRSTGGDEPAREYDFDGAVRGKYVRRISGGGSLVTIPADLALVFPSSKAVQQALSAYRDARVRELIIQLRAKPIASRQKIIRTQLRRLGHHGGLKTA